jgi:hypothetical protein
MYYYKAFNLIVQSEIAIPSFVEAKAQTPDIQILLGKITPPAHHEKTNVARHGIISTYGEYTNASDCFMGWGNKLNIRIKQGQSMTIDLLDPNFAGIVHLFAEAEAFGILLYQKNYLLLHASAITLPNGKGIVFMGEPGMGKSTTCAAFVKAGCTLITDDLVAIKVHDGKPYLVPSYPQLKIWGTSAKGLAYEKPSLHRLIEGIDKFAYKHHPHFNQDLVPLQGMYELCEGIEADQTLELIHVPMRMVSHFALPKQMIGLGQPLKNYFERCLAIAPSFSFVKKPQMKSFEQLNQFVHSFLE